MQADPDFGQIGKGFKLKLVNLEDTQNGWLKGVEELFEIMGYSIAFIALVALGGLILFFVGKWTGKL